MVKPASSLVFFSNSLLTNGIRGIPMEWYSIHSTNWKFTFKKSSANIFKILKFLVPFFGLFCMFLLLAITLICCSHLTGKRIRVDLDALWGKSDRTGKCCTPFSVSSDIKKDGLLILSSSSGVMHIYLLFHFSVCSSFRDIKIFTNDSIKRFNIWNSFKRHISSLHIK